MRSINPDTQNFWNGLNVLRKFRLQNAEIISQIHTMAFIELTSLPQKEIVDGYLARTIHTGSLTLVYWTVAEGAAMPVHSHMHQQVAHVIKGQFQLQVGDETRIVEPGVVAVIPPNVPHGGIAITECWLLDVFNPERDDYKF